MSGLPGFCVGQGDHDCQPAPPVRYAPSPSRLRVDAALGLPPVTMISEIGQRALADKETQP